MGNLNVIDRFMATFTHYIDSGFGLLNSDVASLTTILVGIDITLAGTFWAMDGESNVMGRLIKKTLYIGTFAFILNNFSMLANVIFSSFAGLGLHVTNNGLTAQDLLRPGRLAGTGYQAAWPLLQQIGALTGFTKVFSHLEIIAILLVSWLVVIFAFFVLAVQLFITILEFKLTTLAGFVLVPFALWNRTSFLAERVLGNVVSSGVKVMVLAVIVGIGSGFFGDFINALHGQEPNLAAGDVARARLDLAIRSRHLRSRHRNGPRIGCAATRGWGCDRHGGGIRCGGRSRRAVWRSGRHGGAARRDGDGRRRVDGLPARACRIGRRRDRRHRRGACRRRARRSGCRQRGRAVDQPAGERAPVGERSGRPRGGLARDGRRRPDVRSGPAARRTTLFRHGLAGSAPSSASRARRHSAAQAVPRRRQAGGGASPDLSERER